MKALLKEQLVALSSKYETEEFLIGDPSWYMHQVEGESNQELLAFVAASLSYGSRKQFMPKIQRILDSCESRGQSITQWIDSGDFKTDIPSDEACFYRLQTNADIRCLLASLQAMIHEYGSMKGFVCSIDTKGERLLSAINVIQSLTEWFRTEGSGGVVPRNAQSSCKRLCMYLRWMVRDESPVDLGLWKDIIDKRTLIIPMDTHVVQEANRLGLLTTKSASMKNAIKLTRKLSEAFPDDPLRGDFALFGLGVDANPVTA